MPAQSKLPSLLGSPDQNLERFTTLANEQWELLNRKLTTRGIGMLHDIRHKPAAKRLDELDKSPQE